MSLYLSLSCFPFPLLYPPFPRSNHSSSLESFRWEYIPFHGGPRICLGQQFALTQMSYTLYKFFQVFKSIEARDAELPLRVKTNLTASFADGCSISVVPE